MTHDPTEMAETYRLAPEQREAVRELLELAMPALLADARDRAADDFGPAAFDELACAHDILAIVGWTAANDGPEAPVELDDPEQRNMLRRLAYAALAEDDDWLDDRGERVLEALSWRLERDRPTLDGEPEPAGGA